MSESNGMPMETCWRWSTTSELCESVRDGTHDTPKYVESGVPLITSKNLKQNGIDFSNIRYISQADHAEISKRSGVARGDVLFAMIGTIGNPVEVIDDSIFSIKNVALFKENRKSLNPRYLRYWLGSLVLTNWMKPRLKGTTQKFAPLGLLRKLPIPAPDIAQQTRIVEKIEALFTETDKGIETLKTTQAQLKIYRQAVLKHAFEGKLTEQWRKQNPELVGNADDLLQQIQTERQQRYQQQLSDWQQTVANWEATGKEGKKPVKPKPLKVFTNEIADLSPKGWVSVSLGMFTLSIEAGKSFRCNERPPRTGETGIAKVSAVSWGEYDEAESKTCTIDENINENLLIRKNDFLLSRANTIELVGAVVIAKRVTHRVMLSDKTLRLRFFFVNEAYVLHYLRSHEGRKKIEKLSTGNQESMRNIG